MSAITIFKRDGSNVQFNDEPRPGGSYAKRLTFVEGFVCIEDEWHTKTYIPTQDISQIIDRPTR